jgi:2-polyprenyl-6-methoxyphenol hydroxylase-like FAD-dependent oxidoreductase
VAGKKQITIVGGGLAGLTLGIALRRRDVPVVIWEAGAYPRHRVCGEFISGRGLEVLRHLDLTERLKDAGARPARTAKFFASRDQIPEHELPRPALCLSRFVLDAVLAERFRQLGGDLRCGARWTGSFHGEALVRAAGRRMQRAQAGGRWYGLKAHARNMALEADLEMHFLENCYVGICRLADGEVNVCGLFRHRAQDSPLPRSPVDQFRNYASGILSERLEEAKWDEKSFCVVGGLPFRNSLPARATECCVGDSLAMIPPITGNGMSMAFESAELAAEPLVAFAEGHISWDDACHATSLAYRKAFRTRLFWARWLHSVLFHPVLRVHLFSRLTQWELVWRLFFRLTR